MCSGSQVVDLKPRSEAARFCRSERLVEARKAVRIQVIHDYSRPFRPSDRAQREALGCTEPSTTVALSWYHGRRFRIFAGNGIFGPDADGGVARETSGSQPPHGGLFSRATAPSGAALRAQLAE
jgi:hypothetical protein